MQPAVVDDARAVDGEVGPVVRERAEGVGPYSLHGESALERRCEPVPRRARDCLLELLLAVKGDDWHEGLAYIGEGVDVRLGAEGLRRLVSLQEPLSIHEAVVDRDSSLPARITGRVQKPDQIYASSLKGFELFKLTTGNLETIAAGHAIRLPSPGQ